MTTRWPRALYSTIATLALILAAVLGPAEAQTPAKTAADLTKAGVPKATVEKITPLVVVGSAAGAKAAVTSM